MPSHILFYCLRLCTSLGWTVCLKEVQFQNAYEKSEHTITLKMVDQGRSDFYVVLTRSHTRIKTNVNKFAISSHTVLKLGIQNLGSYMRLTHEYELDILSNTEAGHAKVHGENYMKLRPLLACHLLCNHLLLFLRILK